MALDQTDEATRTAPDHDEIVEHMQRYYIDAFNERDFSKLRRCFYQDAWFFFLDDEGTLYKGQFNDDTVREWTRPDDPAPPFEHRILSVTQAGDAASVVLEMHSKVDPNSVWIDVHALLRIDGEWWDMNKSATHASRAGWALGDPTTAERVGALSGRIVFASE